MNQRTESALLRDAAAHAAQEREGRNQLVVDIAEIDARKAYRQAGYDSTFSYCVHELGLSKKAAFHRIHVARKAWEFPVVLAALSEGRLHLTAVRMLASHLSQDNAADLVEAATGKTAMEVDRLLAQRFPRPELFTIQSPDAQLMSPSPLSACTESSSDTELSCQHPLRGVELEQATSPVTASPDRFPLKVALTREAHENLRRAQELLGHQVPSGDVAEILHRALDLLVRTLEKRKYAVTERPRTMATRPVQDGPSIPAEVRRAVYARDGGQCAFVTATGQRCPARRMLEFDHIQPVARGGTSSISNLRLLCRTHNQYMAEQVLGEKFMRAKREQAHLEAEAKAVNQERLEEVKRCMQRLGFTADESRRAATHSLEAQDGSLESRVRKALAYLVPARKSHSVLPIPVEAASIATGRP
jgi:5-methylcytosine-specific restriction endonuclease McrA